MVNKKRFTFFTDDYPAVTCDSCYEDQNENYTGPAIDRLAEYEATGLMPAEVAALIQELKYAKWKCREDRRWIPVTERLPDDWVDVLARLQCGDCVVAVKSGPIWLERFINIRLEDGDVTHWMPLPEPPKEETP